jgi:hypothetical protein
VVAEAVWHLVTVASVGQAPVHGVVEHLLAGWSCFGLWIASPERHMRLFRQRALLFHEIFVCLVLRCSKAARYYISPHRSGHQAFQRTPADRKGGGSECETLPRASTSGLGVMISDTVPSEYGVSVEVQYRVVQRQASHCR